MHVCFSFTFPQCRIQKKNTQLWSEFTKGHFCVLKSLTDFTSIDPDYRLEQKNRALIVTGGRSIIEITQNEKALDNCFLLATELSKTMHEFENEYGVVSKNNRIQYLQIIGGRLARKMNNASSLTEVFGEHGDPFLREDEEDTVYNLLTKEVINENIAQDIIHSCHQCLYLYFRHWSSSPDQLILTTRGQPLSVLPHPGAWEKSRFFQNDGLTECKMTRFMLLPLTLLKMR